MPLPKTIDLDELAEALAHRDTVREAERQLPDLARDCTAAVADATRETYSGTHNSEQVKRIRDLLAGVRNAKKRLVVLQPTAACIADAEGVLAALKNLRPETKTDPEA